MLSGLVVFRSLLNDPVLLAIINKNESEAVARLLIFAEEQGVVGDVLPYYIFNVISQDDNVFSRTVELNGACGPSLVSYVKKDIRLLLEFLEQHKGLLPAYIPSSPAFKTPYTRSISKIVMETSLGVENTFANLSDHYKTMGRGLAARYIALVWENGLSGIQDFDCMPLEDLIGIELQKKVLVSNTLRLLQGKSANNVLLFGDSGTGKSSCVKALVHDYHDQGLRLLELRKHQLVELDRILAVLGQSKYKYIIFMDDLSFEEGELGYKALKAVLEGKAARIPENVLFYATSNRMHLIRETWSDRVVERQEVHLSDTMQEKLSLSERFGLSVSFILPSQDEYFAIVAHMCTKHGIPYDDDTRAKALRWAMQESGFSGRTARQFISSLD